MSTDKIDPSKKDPKIATDDLTKTTKKGDVELTEEELKRTTGGVTQEYKSLRKVEAHCAQSVAEKF